MGSKNRRRVPNRTATRKPHVPKLRMTVIVHPESAVKQHGVVTLQREVQAIRAAILYADEIEVVSPATEMLLGMKEFAATSDAPVLDLLHSLDTSTLEQLSGRDGDEMKNVLNLLPALQNPAFNDLLEQSGSDEIEELRRSAAEFQDKMGQSTAQIRDDIAAMYEHAGGPELAAATKSGVVKIKPLLHEDDDGNADVLIERYATAVKELLVEGSRHMLLDRGTTQLADLLIKEKRVVPSTLALPNALESIVGTGMITRLPTFGETPADELVDLRRDLMVPLGKYRRSVATLGAKMRVGPFDGDTEAEVEHLYLTEVEPALAEIREQLAEHGLVREFADAVGANLGAVVGGAAAVPGLVVGIQAATDLAAVATAGLAAIPALAGGAAVLAKAKQAQREALIGASGKDLYYLHEIDRRMS